MKSHPISSDIPIAEDEISHLESHGSLIRSAEVPFVKRGPSEEDSQAKPWEFEGECAVSSTRRTLSPLASISSLLLLCYDESWRKSTEIFHVYSPIMGMFFPMP